MDPAHAGALAVLGALTGLLGTILGVGGGVFLVPVLVLWCGVDMAHAAATGLIAVIATSNAAAADNVEKGVANVRLGMVMETATVSGALGGGWLAAVLPTRAVIGLFGALLLGVSLLLWRRRPEEDGAAPGGPTGPFDGSYVDAAEGRTVTYTARNIPGGLGASLAAGSLSGLLGVGGGILKVPAFHIICGLPMKAAAATSNYTIGVTAAAGAAVYLARGAVDAPVAAAVALGVLAGSKAGAYANQRLGSDSVRRLFAALTLVLAVQMLRKAAHG
ncbi:MAG: sulfite exporter TauE/SafE family protein [Elusimicrobia bacterium]|nr:sulfite exporter TauE/SafE family protein [Elusimicrobiota bacterium]